MFHIFNMLFLVMMLLASASQMVLIWFYMKCKQRVPASNIQMTSGTLLLTLATYLGLHTPLYQSALNIVVFISGMVLVICGGVGSYREIKKNRAYYARLRTNT